MVGHSPHMARVRLRCMRSVDANRRRVHEMGSRGRARISAVKPERDAYGQEIWNCYQGKSTYEIAERDDGLIEISSAQPYFREFDDWPEHEREAIQRAHGRILDIGCGAGRVALYLQQKGHQVVAIDNSPVAVKVSRLRGVRDARVLSILDIETLGGPFD